MDMYVQAVEQKRKSNRGMMMKKKMIALLAAMGVMMAPALSTEAAWNVDGTGWWYTHEDGGYAVNQWEQVQGTWYHFDGSGHMQTGWQWIDGSWYYLDGSGAMLTGWQWIDGSWYYMNGSGAMQTGWQVIDGSRDTEVHSGFKIVTVGGIGMETAATQGMAGK